MNLSLPPIFLLVLFFYCTPLTPVLYKFVILLILAQWRLVLPGNTVLKNTSNVLIVMPVCAKV